MDDAASRDLLRPFDSLPDPRAHNWVHPLGNILVIAIMGITCGAPDWESVHRWAKTKAPWLATFLDLSHGIPSRDTFRRLFNALDPEAFERCFVQWTAELARVTEGRLLAIDGKTVRRAFHRASGKSGVHLVSAWCQQNHVVLGQLAVEEKSNEITAIPKLLELLNLKGATVSIDAIGCQKGIAQQIVEAEGDYLLTVKDNHPSLHEGIRFFFEEGIAENDPALIQLEEPQIDGAHGRLEERRLWASAEVGWLERQGHQWAGLRGIVCVECRREVLGPGGKTSVERRYYLTSHDPRRVKAKKLLEMVRGHWAVENCLHWCLDISFREDERRLHTGYGAENFSRLCRLSLNLLKAEKTTKVGIANKRLMCGWDNDYLLKVLMNLG